LWLVCFGFFGAGGVTGCLKGKVASVALWRRTLPSADLQIIALGQSTVIN
jgi:hypothetical protein